MAASDAMVNGLAGAGGGLVAQLLTYPLQAVNTRQQTERKVKKELAESEVSKNDLLKVPRNDLLKVPRNDLLKVLSEEGWGGLYRGLTPSLVGTVASQSVYYYFYQVFRNVAESYARRRKRHGLGDGTVGMSSSLIVAALAGSLNVLLTNPIWVIVTRMQTEAQAEKDAAAHSHSELAKEPTARKEDIEAQSKMLVSSAPLVLHAPRHRGGAAYTIKELYREAGILGFWKGVLPTLIMVSNPALQFMIYETLLKEITKKRKPNKHGMKDVSALETFVIGSLGKLGATIATYPLLVVKSRLQAKQAIGRDKSTQYTGTLDAILKMLRYEGVAGFYKGMSTKIVQSVAAAALLLMIKEELVKAARTLLVRRRPLKSLV